MSFKSNLYDERLTDKLIRKLNDFKLEIPEETRKGFRYIESVKPDIWKDLMVEIWRPVYISIMHIENYEDIII